MQDDKDFNKDGTVSSAEVKFDNLLRDVFVDTDGNYDKEMADQAVAELRQIAQNPILNTTQAAEAFVENYGLEESDIRPVSNVFSELRKSHTDSLSPTEMASFQSEFEANQKSIKDAERRLESAILESDMQADLTFEENMRSAIGVTYDATKPMRDHMAGVKKSRGRSGRLASRSERTRSPAFRGYQTQGGSRIPKPEKPETKRKKTDSSKSKKSKKSSSESDSTATRVIDYAGMILNVRTPATKGPHSESYYSDNGVAARFYGRGVFVDRNRDGKITEKERAEARAIANSGALDPITFEHDKKEMLDRSLKRQQTLKLDPKTYNIGGILVDANGDGIISLIEEEEAKKQALQNNIANVVASREQDKAERFLYGGMTREDAVRRFGEDLVLEREQAALEGPLGDYYAPTIKAATEGGIDPETKETIPRDRSASFGGSAYDIPRGTNTPSESPSQISSPTATMTLESAIQNAPEGGGRVPGGIDVAPRSPQFAPAGATDIPRRMPAGDQLAALGGGAGGGGFGARRGQSSASVSSGEFRSMKREMQTLPNWRTVVG